MTRSDTAFSFDDPLPTGRLAIEASAGTGKTHALATLATRFVAEAQLPIASVLIVTFTRAAASELRGRVRERLQRTLLQLLEPEPPADDPLGLFLYDVGPDERHRRALRLEQALIDFDTATVTTIHGFATQVLATLGAGAVGDVGAVLMDDDDELTAEVCGDVLAAAAFSTPDPQQLPTYQRLRDSVRLATNLPDLAIMPTDGTDQASASGLLHAALVRRCLATVAERRRLRRTLSFSDVLTELQSALHGPRAASAIATLRKRFQVALVDEFQDTDPIQWDIFATLFGSAETRLVLVGDPKQAIYSFRGADVHTYLDAVGRDASRATLEVNWRSDGAAVSALGVLLNGATFGDPAIAFSPVKAESSHLDRRLLGPGGQPLAPVRLRLALEGVDTTKNGAHRLTGDAETVIYHDLVAQLRELLETATLPTEPVRKHLRPSDIAVLVLSAKEAEQIQRLLLAHGIPAVLARGTSVLESPAAEQWRLALEAMARPTDLRRVRAFALSWFVGWSAEQVDRADDEQLAELQDRLHAWNGVLASGGPTDLIRRIRTETGLVPRVLAAVDGDRALTDLDHLGELLADGGAGASVGAAALLALLDRPPTPEEDVDDDRDVTARRIESDAQAVQIMTVWVAKGLQFPVVCCPTLWRKPRQSTDRVAPDATTGRRCLAVGGGGPWRTDEEHEEREEWARREAVGERLRLTYVALTRAVHLTLVWWSRIQDSDQSSLARLLFARQGAELDLEQFEAPRVALPADADALAALEPLRQRAGGLIEVSMVPRQEGGVAPWSGLTRDEPPPDLLLAELTRQPDRTSRRWSFTALAAEHAVAGDPEDDSEADAGAADEGNEPAEPDVSVPGVDLALDASAPLAQLPAGAAFGTLVHHVLEEVDFAAPNLEELLLVAIDRQLAWSSLDLSPVVGGSPEGGRALLAAGLAGAIATPLGAAVGRSLRQVVRTDRVDEMAFDLRLGDAGRLPRLGDVGRLVADHLAPDHPLAGWARSLDRDPHETRLGGHLTGSIDALLRVRVPGQPDRYAIVDYKTNRLRAWGQPPAPGDYGPASLVAAMEAHDYPLQALLYAVAVHRYLRWRLPGYDPSVNLGPALYLFVRGMTGPDVTTIDGASDGVFTWTFPPGLVPALSDLLAGR